MKIKDEIEAYILADEFQSDIADLNIDYEETADVNIESLDRVINSYVSNNEEKIKALCDSNDGMLVYPDKRFGIYRLDDFSYGGYGLHLGDYKKNSREGRTVWIWFDNEYGLISYLGSWVNNVPNGDMTVSSTYGIFEGSTRTITGNMKNGLWDGGIFFSFSNDPESYSLTFTDGIVTVIKTEDDGNGTVDYTVAENSHYVLVFRNEDAVSTWGAQGFAEVPW